MRNGSLTANRTRFLEEKFRFMFTSLTLFPLFPCSLDANRRGNIVMYFSSHMEQRQKMGKFTKYFGPGSATQLLRSDQYR